MKNSYKKLFGSLLMLWALSLSGCHQPDAEIDTLDYSRALQPLNFAAVVDRETGYDVNFTWTIAENTDYLLSIQEVNESGTAVGTPAETLIPAAEASSPYKVTLTPERIYTATLQAFSATNPNLPGSLLVEAGPVETYYVMESLNPELLTRSMNSITVKWTNDEGDATQLTKIVAAPLDSKSGAQTSTVEVTSEILAAQQAEVTGLTPSTQYVVTLYQSKSTRGGVTAWTAPDTKDMTLVKNSAELMQALNDGAEKIAVQAGETYVLEFSGTNPLDKWKGDLELVGVLGDDGSMPVIKNFELKCWSGTDATTDATGIYRFENIVFEGLGSGNDGFLFRTGEGADAKVSIESVSVLNCELYNYVSGVVFVSSSTASATIGTVRLESLYIHDFLNQGGDLIDFRTGTINTLTVRNNTIIDAGRAFLFSDVNATFSTIEISNNTLNRVGLTNTRKGIIGVRTAVPTFTLNKNLFLNEYSTSETVRLIHENANAQIPTMSGNYFYNVCYNSTGDENYSGADFFTTKIGNNATAVNQSLCLSGDGKILTSDPCVKSSRNKMELTNSDVAANQVGDPRWWTVSVPETVIASELTAVTEDYEWPLSDDLVFEPQSITETIIYGNLQFIASNEVFPVTITSDHTISLSGATSFTADGEPTNNALAIRVSAAGSLVLTPSNAGIGVQLEIIAGENRYTVPCDGVEHTIGLGDIAGDTHVYVTTTGAVVISSLAWTTEVSVDGDLKALATPAVTVEPASLSWSSEQDVVLTWEAVANAADYEVTWGDQEPVTVTEPTFTIPAATVKTLLVGSYPVKVVARPVATSTKYKASAAGESKFEVTKITLGTPEVTVTPTTLDAGTSQEVVVSWKAVADAETYAVTFNGQTTNQSETSLTLSADVISALAAGRYEITVVAQKPSDTDHYADSAAGAGELEIKAVGAAMTQTWNFTDAGFDEIYNYIVGKVGAGKDFSETWTDEWDGLTIATGGSSIRVNTSNDKRFVQMGGAGNTSKRYFLFTPAASGTLTVVASNTGDSEDTKRMVTVNQNGTESSQIGGVPSSSPVTLTFDIEGGIPTYIYATGNGLRFYSIEFSYVEAPTATEKTMMLTKDNLADLGLPEGKDDVKALTAPSTWSYEGKAFESVMALSSTSNSASVKVPVLYLYKSTENTALGANYVRSTESLGEKIQKITVTFVDSGKKKGNKLSMYEYVGGEKKLVLSDNESDSDAEVLTYVFSEANDGKFSLENVSRSGNEGDLKIVSIQIDYLGE